MISSALWSTAAPAEAGAGAAVDQGAEDIIPVQVGTMRGWATGHGLVQER